MSIPQNLKSVLDEKAKQVNPETAKIITKMTEDGSWNNPLVKLVSASASSLLGYSHGSDKYDEMDKGQIAAELGLSDDPESSDIRDIRDNFGQELASTYESIVALNTLESFKEVLEKAQELGFTGTPEELSTALCLSSDFRYFAQDQVSRYEG